LKKYGSKLPQIEADFNPHAQDVAHLAYKEFEQGNYVIAEEALPIYLRGAGAWKKSSQQ
jgi:tRNA A37 threonylcarbamoyladenosine modification protein TsaB